MNSLLYIENESVYAGMNVMILPKQLKKKSLSTKYDDDSLKIRSHGLPVIPSMFFVMECCQIVPWSSRNFHIMFKHSSVNFLVN